MSQGLETHKDADPLGGMFDGMAVGLGLGALSTLFSVHNLDNLKYSAIFAIIAVLIGGTLGSMWGRNRGY
jgi:hypothetical protein